MQRPRRALTAGCYLGAQIYVIKLRLTGSNDVILTLCLEKKYHQRCSKRYDSEPVLSVEPVKKNILRLNSMLISYPMQTEAKST